MKRREFLTLLGATAAWPLSAHAQQPGRVPSIGFLGLTSAAEWARYVAAFRQGLREAGFVEGDNVTVDYRWAEGHYDRLPAMAADLVQRPVDLIVPVAPPAARVAKAATTTIPIVFFMGSDPVQLGLIASLSRPGGNITGATALANALGAKRLELMREVLPAAAAYGLLVNPTNQNAGPDTGDIRKAAATLDTTMVVANGASEADIDAAFDTFASARVSGVIVNPDPFLLAQRKQIVALATRHRMASIFHLPEPVAAGGLMSYGASFPEAHRTVGLYAGRILKGAKPADLPVPQPTKFDLVINLKTANALGLALPPSLLARADEVIE
jgi:ABC-type uncharacterized transport system substrate-binding protein